MRFQEWLKTRKKQKKSSKRPVTANRNIDSFLQSVDNLKKDFDILRGLADKKAKETPKVEIKPEKEPAKSEKPDVKNPKPEDEEQDSFQNYTKKRDEDGGEDEEAEEPTDT